MVDQQQKKIDRFTFSLKDTIGQGSFGKVFKGKDESTGMVAAIKMIDKKMIKSDEYLYQGLLSEIKVMKCLKSPQVVQLYDVMETTNNYYIIQEFCDGGDFRHLLKQKKKLPESEAIFVLQDILVGFIDLLKHGIIHRDLKPENILIHQGRYKLADFGFARTVDNFSRQMLNSLVGTPLYMSPQILKHEKYTTKSDIWSIALIYYEMLYGKTPWPARSQYELVQNITTKQIEFASNIEVSDNSKDFIQKCLAIAEEARITWGDIYLHPLFKGYFGKMVLSKEDLENKASFIINSLRSKINSSQTDLESLFQTLNMNKQSKMDMKQFSFLMNSIDETLQREEIEYIFNKFDADKDGTVDFQEFNTWLVDNNVRMSCRPLDQQNQANQKKQSIMITQSMPIEQQFNKMAIEQQQQIPQLKKQMTQNTYNKALKVIEKLAYALEKYNISAEKLFNKFDNSANQNLDVKEFTQMILRIDKTLSNEEIELSFSIFDADSSGEISFQEFNTTLAIQQQKIKQHQHQIQNQPQLGQWGQNGSQQQQQQIQQQTIQNQNQQVPQQGQQYNPYQQQQQQQQQQYSQQQYSQSQQQQYSQGYNNQVPNNSQTQQYAQTQQNPQVIPMVIPNKNKSQQQ